MLEPDQLDSMVEAIRHLDPEMPEEDAAQIAASIGDTPLIVEGKVIGTLRGKDYPVPVAVLYPDDAE